jgi:hypothetical protein
MNDRYKSCFMSIVFILLMVVALLILSMSFSSCHTQKQTNQSATASAMAATVASQDLASVSRQKLDRSLSLQLDDLEILFPVPGADGRFAQGEMTDSVEGLAWQEAPSMLGDLRAPARLRARKATITAAAAQEHEDVKTAHLEDSTIRQETAHNTMEKSVDTTAVAKPVLPWALIIILAVAALAIASRIGKR